jgi:hypothetical protein
VFFFFEFLFFSQKIIYTKQRDGSWMNETMRVSNDDGDGEKNRSTHTRASTVRDQLDGKG